MWEEVFLLLRGVCKVSARMLYLLSGLVAFLLGLREALRDERKDINPGEVIDSELRAVASSDQFRDRYCRALYERIQSLRAWTLAARARQKNRRNRSKSDRTH